MRRTAAPLRTRAGPARPARRSGAARARALVLAVATLASPAAATAQQDPLDDVERLAAGGRMTQARARLDDWERALAEGSATAPAEQRARALLLRGRLALDAGLAREAYLDLVLAYPSSHSAPEGLLRLGQGLLALGDAERAAVYLRRLTQDFPRDPHRPAGLVWLARAQAALGEHAAACETATRADRDGAADPETSDLLRFERDAACAAPPTPLAGPTTRTPGNTTRRAPAEPPPAAASAGVSGAFAVQSAALRNRAAADALAARLRRAGFDARVTALEGSALVRVRIGRFDSRAAAATVAREVRAAGFEAVVVDDARREHANHP